MDDVLETLPTFQTAARAPALRGKVETLLAHVNADIEKAERALSGLYDWQSMLTVALRESVKG